MDSKEKLRVGIITNNILLKTGLARAAKCWVPDIYKTGKYEIFFLNQSFADNDPNFRRFPWKSFGALNHFDQNRFNSDFGYQKFVSYGNAAVESFVTENKLDVVFHIDDIWSASEDAYLKSDWYPYIKENFVQWATADSEPILPDFKKWAENCPNMWFWATFAEKRLKEENIQKYGHCKTMFPPFDTSKFYPLSQNERLELRKKFNIKDDEKVIIYVFRNQLRKQVWAMMEALKKFKEKFPDKKTKLLLHTSFSEPNGWPIDRITEELGLDKNDILCTYFCKSCANWSIEPHYGEDIDCKHCGSKKSRITVNISSTIDELDLNKIYNIADGSCSPATSGGSELTSQESMLAGVPFCSFPYSCGEDYVSNDFVFKMEGYYTREVGSGFKKFVPSVDSIANFYEFIHNLTPENKKEITEKARNWTVQNFDSKVIVAKIEEFLDSRKKINWDSYFESRKKLKEVSANIEDKQNDDDFVLECYQKILGMNPSKEDEGRIHWNRYLSQNGDKSELKKQMVKSFRIAASQHNQKVAPKVPFDKFLDENDKERVLIVLKESIGDAVILTALLPEIKKKYPNSSIYISIEKKYWEIFNGNPYVHRLIEWRPEHDNELLMIGINEKKKYFNTYINLAVSTQKILNYLSNKY